MKKFFLTLSIPAAFGVQTAFAQVMRPSLRDSLQTISDQMFQKGSANFIIVDAVKDGILKLRTPFEFSYQDGTIGFTGIQLSEKMQKDYTAKFRAFLIAQNAPTEITASWRADSVRMNLVFDTNSHFWYRTMEVNSRTLDTDTK